MALSDERVNAIFKELMQIYHARIGTFETRLEQWNREMQSRIQNADDMIKVIKGKMDETPELMGTMLGVNEDMTLLKEEMESMKRQWTDGEAKRNAAANEIKSAYINSHHINSTRFNTIKQ